MGFLLVPGVPLGAWTPLPELMEEVRDLFIMASSATEAIPLFRLPGLEEGKEKHFPSSFRQPHRVSPGAVGFTASNTQSMKLKDKS